MQRLAPLVFGEGTSIGFQPIGVGGFRGASPTAALVATQNPTLTPRAGARIDSLAVASLTNDTQYAVTAPSIGGTVVAIVQELASGGEKSMIYV